MNLSGDVNVLRERFRQRLEAHGALDADLAADLAGALVRDTERWLEAALPSLERLLLSALDGWSAHLLRRISHGECMLG